MYLCKEYARSQATKTDNMPNNKIFCSASIIARDLYRASTNLFFCIFKVGRMSAASHVHVHVGRHFWHDRLKYLRYLLTKNCVFVIYTGGKKKVWVDHWKNLLHFISHYTLFFLYKNIVFQTQAGYSYFSAYLRQKNILENILKL